MDASDTDTLVFDALTALFSKYDLDESGYIDSEQELHQLVTNTGFLAMNTFDLDISENEIDTFIAMHLDRVIKGPGISLKEFVTLVVPAFKFPASNSQDALTRVLETSVIANEPKSVLGDADGRFTRSHLRDKLYQYFKKYDFDDSGRIDDEQELKLLSVNTAFLASEFDVFVKQTTIDNFVADQLPKLHNGGLSFDDFVDTIVEAYGFPNDVPQVTEPETSQDKHINIDPHYPEEQEYGDRKSVV